MVSYLDDCAEELTKLRAHSETLNDYQDAPKQAVTGFETLHGVVADHSLKTRLWTGLRDWAELANGWNATEFHHIKRDPGASVERNAGKGERHVDGALPRPAPAPNVSDSVQTSTPLY